MFELHEDEKVIMFIRKHWIFLFREIITVFLVFIIPVSFVWYLQLSGSLPNYNLFQISINNLVDIFVYIWAILCWLFMTEKFTKFALNFWVLTNKRIIESEFSRLFSRRISTLELDDVEDVTVGVAGFIQTIIGYGTLEVQTAGASREFLADNVRNPVWVQEQIFESKLDLKRQGQGKTTSAENNLEKYFYKKTSKHQGDSHSFSIPQDQNRYDSSHRIPEKTSEDVYSGTQKTFDWAHNIKNSDAVEDGSDKVQDVYDSRFEDLEDKYKKDSQKALRIE